MDFLEIFLESTVLEDYFCLTKKQVGTHIIRLCVVLS